MWGAATVLLQKGKLADVGPLEIGADTAEEWDAVLGTKLLRDEAYQWSDHRGRKRCKNLVYTPFVFEPQMFKERLGVGPFRRVLIEAQTEEILKGLR